MKILRFEVVRHPDGGYAGMANWVNPDPSGKSWVVSSRLRKTEAEALVDLFAAIGDQEEYVFLPHHGYANELKKHRTP